MLYFHWCMLVVSSKTKPQFKKKKIKLIFKDPKNETLGEEKKSKFQGLISHNI